MELKQTQLCGLLECRTEGLHADDEKVRLSATPRRAALLQPQSARASQPRGLAALWPGATSTLGLAVALAQTIERLLAQRESSVEWKVKMLVFYCEYIINLREVPDREYVPVSAPGTPDHALDAAMDVDKDLSQTTLGPGTPASAASQSATATSPPAPGASPLAAATSLAFATHAGRPAVKAAAGKEAQQLARQVDRLQRDNKLEQAEQLLLTEQGLSAEIPEITSEYAAKQAKTAAKWCLRTPACSYGPSRHGTRAAHPEEAQGACLM